MITCPNCNKELDEGVKFCDGYGQAITNQNYCPKCEEPLQTNEEPCSKCGASVTESAGGVVLKKKKTFPVPKKWIAIGTAYIALVLVLIITLTSIFSGSAGSYALYLKGNEMYFTMTSEVEPKRVTKELVGDSEDDYGLSIWRAYFASNYTKLSKDGEKLFYCSNLGNYGGFSLNYRFVDKLDKSPVEIDTGVSDYAIDENGEVVIYRLEENDDKKDEGR